MEIEKILISLPIMPHGQERIRFSCVHGKPIPFKSKTQQFAEKELEEMLKEYAPPEPFVGALYLKCLAVYPKPKTRQGKLISTEPLDRYYKEPYLKKPDIDNIVKHIMDCMTRTGYFEDDKQIIHLSATKVYDDIDTGRLLIDLGYYKNMDFQQLFGVKNDH